MTVLERISHTLRTVFAPPVPALRPPLPPLQPQAKSLRDPALTALWSDPRWTDSPVSVTERTALHYPAVWAAVQTIAGDVASLPFFHYRRRSDGGKERFAGSKLYKVLHDEFNAEMSAMTGRETLTAHVLLWGNGYAEIVRNDLGQVTALYPIEPDRVTPDRAESGAVIYRVQTGQGADVIVPAARILHVVGLGWNGLMGYSVIGMQRASLGVAFATERLGGQVMERGAKYSGFFEHPRTLGATAHKNLKESIASDLPGSYRILEEGMVYKPGSMSLSDAQYLEIRKFSVTEVARIFGIPPHKIGDLERATFSNIEESNIDYVISTLRRWLVRWEQECNRKLIPPLEKTQQFCEHLVDGLLRGNIQSRYSAYSQGINNGFLSPNDIRKFENLDPIDGGDTYLVQGAMVPLDRLDELVDKQVRPPPAPVVPVAEPVDAEPEEDVEDEDARMARVVGKIFENLRTEFVASVPAAVVAALPPAPEPVPPPEPPPLRDLWREAAFSVIAGTLVRRERAQLRKRQVEAYYRDRFVPEALAELRPWLLRLPDPEQREQATQHVLTVWADAALQTCLATPDDLDGVLARCGDARQAALAQALMEAIDG